MWSGTRHVDRRCFDYTLHEGKSVLIVPGGISELRLSRSSSKVIELSARHLGFARMALTHGTPIVPVFSFGETLTLDQVRVPLLSALAFKVLKMPFPYFTGVGGVLQIPRRARSTVVVGQPIEVGRDSSPSHEKVKLLYREVYHQIEELFEKHKRAYRHGDYTLKIRHLE